MTAGPKIPTATYRLQFSRHFTFRDAARLVPYLSALCISHIYASPYLKARSGSLHGYDITDYTSLNPEIGDEEDFAALTAALKAHDMGHIIDFVPNHMGISKADNAWWLDVLEWGRASPFAGVFDIDWFPAKRELRGKVLLPFLGDHYGQVLENGELKLAFDGESASFGVWYYEHLFPLCPAHYGDILTLASSWARNRGKAAATDIDALEALAKGFRAVRPAAASARRRVAAREEGLRLKRELADEAGRPAVRGLIDKAVELFTGTPGDARSFIALHRLLERQSYRLAYWRVAADEINYRRFFDINDLAGVRMERPDVFETAHELVWRWFAEGRLDGMRIDHIDGLLDPAQYCRRLTSRLDNICAGAGNGASGRPYLVVEKILARHEFLRQDWPVDGTTGYETLNLINGLFVAPDGERLINRIYRHFTGQSLDFDEIVYACKKHIMQHALSSELQMLGNDLDRICESNWRTRDFTLARLRDVLEEVAACFPVYRTYVDKAGATPEDRRYIDWAVSVARKLSVDPESTVFDFVHAVLTTDLARRRGSGYNRSEVVRFAKRFQQFTSPVTAKAVEDTSFYRYVRLISLNEVGGDPRRFGVSVPAFHHLNQERARNWPRTMVTTATHDTKRGEDARTRIDVLSEVPGEWARQVRRWATLNRWARQRQEERSIPGRNDEYFLYQTLIGSWPNELMDSDHLPPEGLEAYRQRVEACMIKAVREAKLHSSWANPDGPYEDALSAFVRRILDAQRSISFLSDFTAFARRIAWFGTLNSLSQLVLKLTVPGVPDIYQGAELWDLSMVDPDNRHPVDFAHRAGLLDSLGQRFDGRELARPTALAELIGAPADGSLKLLVTQRLLQLRRRHPHLFLAGDYLPLEAGGPEADRLCAFSRVHEGETLIVAVPRLIAGMADAGTPPIGGCWRDTTIALPSNLQSKAWRDAISGAGHDGRSVRWQTSMPLWEVFGNLPFTVLLAE